MDQLNFTNNIFIPSELSYPGKLDFKYETIKFKDSLTTNIYDTLENSFDFSINSKDFNIITDHINPSTVFNPYFSENTPKSFISYLKTSDNRYLYHDGNEIYIYGSTTELTQYYYFKFNFIDNKTLYISHKLSTSTNETYLYFDGTDFNFSANNQTIFNYSIDYTNKKIVLIVPEYGIVRMGPYSITVTNSLTNITTYSYIEFIDQNGISGTLEPPNSEFITYNSGIQINNTQSLKLQKLLTDSYKSSNTNLLQLKNTVTNSGYHTILSKDDEVGFKTYTGIHGGNKQNHYDQLFLGFDSKHHEVILKSDQINYFHVPSNIGEYSKININDLPLIQNGAIGGDSPLNSDKIFKRLENYTKTNNNGETFDQENGEYLCSWLFYNPQTPENSVWIDRYYLPKTITKLNALKTSTYTELSQLINKPQRYYRALSAYSLENRTGSLSTGVFDVISNLTFEPYAYYVYHHIGQNDSQTLINSYINNVLIEDFSTYTGEYTESNGIKSYSFNGEYAYTSLIPLLYEKNFTLQFNIKINNPYNVQGYNILGNFTDNKGIGLVKDDFYSPFTYTFEDNQVVVFHCETKQITHRFELPQTIKFIIHTNTFSKFFVLDIDNMLYEINNNNVIINKYQLDANKGILDFCFYNDKIYFLYDYRFYFTFDINTYTVGSNVVIGRFTYSNKIVITSSGTIKTIYCDNRVDITAQDVLIYLNENAIWKQGFSSPLLSCGDINESIKDFIIDEKDDIYILTNYRVVKIKDSVNVRGNFTTVDLHDIILAANNTASESLSALSANGGNNLVGVFQINTPSKIAINRYMKNGINQKYIELYDYKFDNYQFYSFSDDFKYYKSINTTLSGFNVVDFSYPNNIRCNKFNYDNNFKFKVTLQNIYTETDITYLTFPVAVSDLEHPNTLFTFLFNNELGNATLYLNDKPIGTQSFNKNKYYFSNQLLNRKLYAAASLYDKEVTLSEKLGDGFFISKGFDINRLKIYDFALSYYDILNTLRAINGVEDVVFPLPIQTRTYLDEISGIFKQNKSIRNSEYININVHTALLTDEQKTLVREYITNDMLPELSVNKQILNINFI